MTVKYRIPCSETDIYVLDKGDSFHLTIGSRVNPLSYGNKISDYVSLGKAIDAADKFCAMFKLSKEYGYHLEGSAFEKDGMPPIPVPEWLEGEVSVEAMREQLDRNARQYEA